MISGWTTTEVTTLKGFKKPNAIAIKPKKKIKK